MTEAKGEPTDAELAALRVLWASGPLTVRDVHDQLYRGTRIGYTTTLKLLQNLLAKRMVRRDERTRQHVYHAVVEQEATMRGVIRGFIDRTFDGSAASLAIHALGSGRTSAAELAELKALIRRLERDRGTKPESGR